MTPDLTQRFAGRCRYLSILPDSREASAKIYVPIRPGRLNETYYAQLDTGAAWSMLERELAAELGLFEADGEAMTIDTRLGNVKGKLTRVDLTLLPDEGDGGSSLTIEATVFVSNDWGAGNFLGYSGLLERIRLGVDPGPDEERFYFGSAD